MPYIGNQPSTGDFPLKRSSLGAYHVLDSITLSNGQSAYTMQLDGVNFSPQSVNHMLVIINGVPQPASAYSINGHTLTLSSAATTGDVLNEIRVFGDVLNIGTPSDATVTNAKTNFVSTSSAAGLQIKGDGTTDGTLQLNCSQNSHGVKIASPNHAAAQSYTLTLPSTAPSNGKALITDGSGNLSFADAGGGYVHLSGTTHTATATLDFTTSDVLDLSKYRKYMLRIAGVKADTGSSGSLNMQVFHSGSIQTGSVYKYVYLRHRLSSSSTSGSGSTGTTSIIINPSNYSGSATGMEHNGEVFVDFTPYYFTMNSLTSSYHNTSLDALTTNMSAGIYFGNSSQNVTGFRILMSSNNIKGRIDLYGITNSLGDNGDW